MNYAHNEYVTDIRLDMQAPFQPILSTSRLRVASHTTGMDLVFDLEAVREAMARLGVSQATLARDVGLTHQSAMSKILKGQRKVEVAEAAKIYDRLNIVPVEHTGVRVIPVIGFTSAGSWREAVQVPIGRMSLPQHIAGVNSFAVEVQGDSMNKLIDDGGWIVVDPNDKVLRAGKCYLLQNDSHEVTVKQYAAAPPRFEPVSDNSEHVSFLVSEFEFKVLGRVVWKGSSV